MGGELATLFTRLCYEKCTVQISIPEQEFKYETLLCILCLWRLSRYKPRTTTAIRKDDRNKLCFPLMKTRRHHTKSRQGCKQCKQRKVKCDEQKPQCNKCKIRCIECQYPTPGSLTWPDGHHGLQESKYSNAQDVTPPPPNGSLALLESMKNICPDSSTLATDNKAQALDHESLRLLINWFTSTIYTVACDDKSIHTTQTVISKAAMSHDFLMHGILALSALHLADQGDDTERAKYSTIALHHHGRGLALYQPVLEDINASNLVASLGFSSITIMCTFALSRPMKRAKTLAPLHELLNIFLLIKGWYEVLRVAAPKHQTGSISVDGSIEDGPEIPDATRIALESLHELNRVEGQHDVNHDVDFHAEIIDSLALTLKKILARKNDPHVLGTWGKELPHRFITLLMDHNSFGSSYF